MGGSWEKQEGQPLAGPPGHRVDHLRPAGLRRLQPASTGYDFGTAWHRSSYIGSASSHLRRGVGWPGSPMGLARVTSYMAAPGGLQDGSRARPSGGRAGWAAVPGCRDGRQFPRVSTRALFRRHEGRVSPPGDRPARMERPSLERLLQTSTSSAGTRVKRTRRGKTSFDVAHLRPPNAAPSACHRCPGRTPPATSHDQHFPVLVIHGGEPDRGPPLRRPPGPGGPRPLAHARANVIGRAAPRDHLDPTGADEGSTRAMLLDFIGHPDGARGGRADRKKRMFF